MAPRFGGAAVMQGRSSGRRGLTWTTGFGRDVGITRRRRHHQEGRCGAGDGGASHLRHRARRTHSVDPSLLWQPVDLAQCRCTGYAKFSPGMVFGAFGGNTRLYSLSLTNGGCGPIQVTQYGFRMPTGPIMIQSAREEYPKVPATLGGKHELSLMWTAAQIDEAVQLGRLLGYSGRTRSWVMASGSRRRSGFVQGEDAPTIVAPRWWNRWRRRRGKGRRGGEAGQFGSMFR